VDAADGERGRPGLRDRALAALDAVGNGNRERLAALASAELDAAGGPLFEGYWADGRPLLDD
jgi:hypothetical protein